MAGKKKLGAECISLPGSWPDFRKTQSPALGDSLIRPKCLIYWEQSLYFSWYYPTYNIHIYLELCRPCNVLRQKYASVGHQALALPSWVPKSTSLHTNIVPWTELQETFNLPLRAFRGRQIRAGEAPQKNSRFFGPSRKFLPDFQKFITLAFLKTTCSQISC